MKLSAQTVDKLQPSDRRKEIPDDLCTGLYLVVQPSGKKGWQVRYRHAGMHRRMTLGAYPVLSLADARARAREVLADASEGRHRKRIEEAFGWAKTIGGAAQTAFRGIELARARFIMTLAAGNLARLPKLLAA